MSEELDKKSIIEKLETAAKTKEQTTFLDQDISDVKLSKLNLTRTFI